VGKGLAFVCASALVVPVLIMQMGAVVGVNQVVQILVLLEVKSLYRRLRE
jgi:hypothetical protein